MNRIYGWYLIIRNYIWLSLKKKFCDGEFDFSYKQKIGKYSSVEISNDGKLELGDNTIGRSGLHLKIDKGILIIGNQCFFNHNCSITAVEQINIGDYCTFGNNLVIIDHDHNFRSSNSLYISRSVVVQNNCWVGANVTICKGVHIGENCVVAAGSIVCKNIPDNSIYIKGEIHKIVRS